MTYESHRAARLRDIERQGREAWRYCIVSDAQLKRDLRPRTLKRVYAENKAGRGETSGPARSYAVDLASYIAWCAAQRHEPSPGSVLPDHPIARQREGLRYVKRETVRED